jgi:hypothetical protein
MGASRPQPATHQVVTGQSGVTCGWLTRRCNCRCVYGRGFTVKWVPICGGRGRHSRKTPDELLRYAERSGLNGDSVVRASRLAASVLVSGSGLRDGHGLARAGITTSVLSDSFAPFPLLFNHLDNAYESANASLNCGFIPRYTSKTRAGPQIRCERVVRIYRTTRAAR